jgi:DNA-binding LacI/PurR family transcriptional regulator
VAETKSNIISQDILARISQGDLAGKISLPTELALAEHYKASRPTIRKAVMELQQAGYITSVKGSGSYITAEIHGAGQRGPGPENTKSLLGVIFPNMGPGYFFDPLANRLAQCAAANGYSLILGGHISPDTELFKIQIFQICEHYLEQKIQGLFFSPFEYHNKGSQINDEILKIFSSAGIPVVLIDSNTKPYPFSDDFDLVCMDHIQAAYTISSHMIEQGVNRLFFVAPPYSHESVRLRLMGFHEALLDHRIPAGPELFIEIERGDETSLTSFIKAKNPEGILCSNDVTAIEVMHTLEKLGVNIPGDISLAGFDNLSHLLLLTRTITSIEQPTDAICRTAIRLMIDRITDPNKTVSKTTFPGSLVLGDTTKRSEEVGGRR